MRGRAAGRRLLLLRSRVVHARERERGAPRPAPRPPPDETESRRRRHGTLRTSFPRTWPSSRRSCASAARSSGKTSSTCGRRLPLLHERRDVLAEVVAARAHEDVVDLVVRRTAPAAARRARPSGRRGAGVSSTSARPSPPQMSSAASAPSPAESSCTRAGTSSLVVVDGLGAELAQEVVVGRRAPRRSRARRARPRAGSRGGRRRRRRRARRTSRPRAGRERSIAWWAVSAASGIAPASSKVSSRGMCAK